ncbi:MAG: NAD-dependent epimerase/dehydratase family protein [Gemmatimonadota bacterium]
MRAYVTGGTGLLGSHIVEQLRRRGDDVRALVRPTSDTSFLESVGAELVRGDVLDAPDALAAGMRGCDVVVHAAALVFTRASWKRYVRINVEGTTRVLTAAGQAAAERVLHVSSVAAYGWTPDREWYREDDWLEPRVPHSLAYAHSKQASEARAWELHRAGVVRLTTVRPPVIYGERDRSATPVLARWASLRRIPVPGGARTPMPLVYAGNVARGVLAALDRRASIGRAYNLGQDVPVSLQEALAGFARGLGREPRFLMLPTRPAAALARVVDGLTKMVPGLSRTRARRAIRLVTRGNPYDSARARLELGWTNLTPHDVALRRTAEWWLDSSCRRGGRTPS